MEIRIVRNGVGGFRVFIPNQTATELNLTAGQKCYFYKEDNNGFIVFEKEGVFPPRRVGTIVGQIGFERRSDPLDKRSYLVNNDEFATAIRDLGDNVALDGGPVVFDIDRSLKKEGHYKVNFKEQRPEPKGGRKSTLRDKNLKREVKLAERRTTTLKTDWTDEELDRDYNNEYLSENIETFESSISDESIPNIDNLVNEVVAENKTEPKTEIVNMQDQDQSTIKESIVLPSINNKRETFVENYQTLVTLISWNNQDSKMILEKFEANKDNEVALRWLLEDYVSNIQKNIERIGDIHNEITK